MIKKLVFKLLLIFLLGTQSVLAQMDVKVEVTGVEKELEDNVRLLLSIEQQKSDALISVGRLKRLHQKAPSEIRKALQPFGYYRVSIDSKLELSDDNVWNASYHIDPGKPVPIGVLDFVTDESVKQDPAFVELMEGFRLKPGRTFNHAEYETIKSDLARLASERGYFNARFSQHRVEIDLANYEANVYLTFNAGARYHFGAVNFTEIDLKPSLLKRYVPFKQGDPYTLNKLIELQQALNDSDYFRVVEVTPGQPDETSYEVPVSVRLKLRKPHRLSLGLGYGTDTGARAKFGWQIPHYNFKGHGINTLADISELGYSLSTQYSVPIFNPRTDQLIYSAGVVNEKTDSSESTVRTLGVSTNRKRGKWRETLSLNYQQEDFSVADTEGETTLLMPGMSWSRIWGAEFWGNQVIRAFDGLRVDIGLRLASTKAYSDVGFIQLTSSLKAIHRFNDQHRLLTRVRGGRINTDEFDELPSSIRFFSGGAQSVRGFRYESLGPVDDNGDVTGGQYLLEGSIEYEYSLNERWGLALFADMGNAINHLDDDLERGAGFGVRWNSPVGPVRFDLASALTKDGEPWRLHINIGPDL